MIGIVQTGYTLKVQNFEGPLDLLLELIGNSKLSITDISLSQITDQYLHHLKTMQLFNIDIASEFFQIAAQLVYLKTRRLLPSMKNEEGELTDEDELLRRLKEYKKFKLLAHEFETLLKSGDIYYTRGYSTNPINGTKSTELDEMLIGDLLHSIRKYRGYFIPKAIPIKRREINVEAKMETILTTLRHQKMLLFSELVRESKTKIDTIASFLGSIELSFRQKVLLEQMKLFADIEIKKRAEAQEQNSK